jgi:uncharacterized Zn-finger protein
MLGVKPFRCDTCGVSFARNDYLKKHRALHLNPEGQVACPACRQLFSTEEGLRRHMKTEHTSGPALIRTSGKKASLNFFS